MKAWFRALRWYWKLPLAAVAAGVAVVGGYVGIRSVHFLLAEKDPALYVPAGSSVVLRLRDFEGTLERVQRGLAWRVLERKLLRDPALRKWVNGALGGEKLPTLDDLEDRRKSASRILPWVLEGAGKDAAAAWQGKKGDLCGIVRLRWWMHLAAPLAGWVLPGEAIEGGRALRVRAGRKDVWVAFRGALALASTDRGWLEQALRRRGSPPEPGPPVELRIDFEDVPELKRTMQASGAFPYVRFETARRMELSVDIDGALIRAEARLPGAEALLGTPTPSALRSWAPETATGVIVLNTGVRDVISWLREGSADPGPRDAGRKNVLQALELLEDAGLGSAFLPKTEPGLAIVTGSEEREGRVYPTFALIAPSRDPRGAAEAMTALVRKRAGKWAEKSFLESQPVEETTMLSWRWPEALEINDFLRPSYAPLKDAFVLANNRGFCEQVIRTASQGGGLDATAGYRRLQTRLKELGFAAEPELAWGYLSPPQIRESLDGLLLHFARQRVYAGLDAAKHRAAVVAELKTRLGREPQEAEITEAYNQGIERMKEDGEEQLKSEFRALESLKWLAFEAGTENRGVRVKVLLELR
jgi:hypothetical protein